MSDEIATFVRDKLGHEPKDLGLFERALTHSSLGRRQLRAARIPRRPRARPGHRRTGSTSAIPNEPEGKLSRRYNALVARETCAEIGRELGVPALIRLGKQAREDGASQSDNVVGDVVEALIGALFLDGGLEAAERFILTAWAPYLDGQRPGAAAPQVGASGAGRRARGCKPPVYEVVVRTGAHHAPRFTVRVSRRRGSARPRPKGSKQEAETAAAAALLEQLQ